MKKSHIVLLVFMALAFAVILFRVNDYSSYETFETASKHVDKEFHVVGNFIREKGLDYNPALDANVFSFYMEDQDGKQSKVICNGDKPQDFEMSEQIVAIGKMNNGVFYANKLLTKCPSKYSDEEIAQR